MNRTAKLALTATLAILLTAPAAMADRRDRDRHDRDDDRHDRRDWRGRDADTQVEQNIVNNGTMVVNNYNGRGNYRVDQDVYGRGHRCGRGCDHARVVPNHYFYYQQMRANMFNRYYGCYPRSNNSFSLNILID